MLACEEVLHGLVFEDAAAGFLYSVNSQFGMLAEGRYRRLLDDVVDLFLREIGIFEQCFARAVFWSIPACFTFAVLAMKPCCCPVRTG